jgi:hypothetical protein
MSLEELCGLLKLAPVMTKINPVSISFLQDDIVVIQNPEEAAWLLDEMATTKISEILITEINNKYSNRFIQFRCNHDPFTNQLNEVLFKHFDYISSSMLTQSNVHAQIMLDATESDVIILFLIDGLSFDNVRSWKPTYGSVSIEPCLVDGPSMTWYGFTNIVRKPSIALKLIEKGYFRRFGFSYWERAENTLTDKIFSAISEVEKVEDFYNILSFCESQILHIDNEKLFIQVLRSGLDGYAHSQKRLAPITAVVSDILNEFEEIIAICNTAFELYGIKSSLYLISDHGILWRTDFLPEVIGNAPSGSSARYCDFHNLHFQSQVGREFIVDGKNYYCLGYPQLRRKLKIDEQGVHGGISYQESIVPFITVKVGL